MKRLRALAAVVLLACVGPAVTGTSAQAAGYPREYFSNATGSGCLAMVATGAPHSRIRVMLAPCDFGANELWTEGNPLPGKTPTTMLVASTGTCLSWGSGFGTNNCGTGTITLPGGVVVPDLKLYWRKQDVGDGTVRIVNAGTGWVLGRNPEAPTAVYMYDPSIDTPDVHWTAIPEGAA